MTKLSTETEVAWLDWLDAKIAAVESGDPKDKERADRLLDEFTLTFLPPEFRDWGKAIMDLMGRK